MLTISVAESATGGLLMAELVSRKGASKYFRGGMVVYSLESKKDILNIDDELITRFNGVSETIAIKMAENVLTKFNSDIGVGITGYAEKNEQEGILEAHAYIAIYVPKYNLLIHECIRNTNNLTRIQFQQFIVYKILEHLEGKLDTSFFPTNYIKSGFLPA